jgi:hypothetical protein
MRQSIKIALVIAWVAISVFLNYGCTIIWTDHAFIYTFAKTVDAKGLGFVADPNSTRIGSGDTKTENDKIKGTAVIGGVPVVIESGE